MNDDLTSLLIVAILIIALAHSSPAVPEVSTLALPQYPCTPYCVPIIKGER